MKKSAREVLMMEDRKLVVAVAGASGYIGQNLLKVVQKNATIIALSRNGDAVKDTETVK